MLEIKLRSRLTTFVTHSRHHRSVHIEFRDCMPRRRRRADTRIGTAPSQPTSKLGEGLGSFLPLIYGAQFYHLKSLCHVQAPCAPRPQGSNCSVYTSSALSEVSGFVLNGFGVFSHKDGTNARHVGNVANVVNAQRCQKRLQRWEGGIGAIGRGPGGEGRGWRGEAPAASRGWGALG